MAAVSVSKPKPEIRVRWRKPMRHGVEMPAVARPMTMEMIAIRQVLAGVLAERLWRRKGVSSVNQHRHVAARRQ